MAEVIIDPSICGASELNFVVYHGVIAISLGYQGIATTEVE
ncbi:hypothetical protein GPAL_3909 [Glaciecola pallidula DSM 14239 = ACAM 615]|jgi:hypothetical protein|uniref:Uncharacterized protein n=1 Tax=Brumicola pallidula DSM 14239 = ACAM 615 TaxID=1121922 RepID=K6YDD2_9ALTE|nr:hypothetical protein GPAL_3909 [Glaciecola pallidula DSM 14239 = ACAM 615]